MSEENMKHSEETGVTDGSLSVEPRFCERGDCPATAMAEVQDSFADDNAVAIDYETYYSTKDDYSLSTMPTWQYCADGRFDPYLVAICGKNIFSPEMPRDPKSVYREVEGGRQLYIGRPERFANWTALDNRLLLAHNASFDEVVTRECWRRGILKPLGNVRWMCTADLSSYLMAPRNLKGAMEVLFGKVISKEVRAAMDGRHDWELSESEYRDLVEYGGSDAVECHDLWLAFASKWPEVERRISEQNREATIEGIHVDRAYAEKALAELVAYREKVMCDIPWTTKVNPKTGEFYKVGSLPALRQAVIDLGVTPPSTFKKDAPEFLDWLKGHDDIPFIRARQTAVALSMHSARIENTLATLDPSDNSHPAFLYFGAHSGRFSGKSDGAASSGNLLNMPRKPVFHGDPNVFGGDGVDIRGMYVPRSGYKFVIFDYSQIEARFSLWLVDDRHMMAAMEREGNLYQANAVAMGWCKSGDKIKKTNPDMYRLAKCCLSGESLVLVRTMKGGKWERPRYKRIDRVTVNDTVWDGHEWVSHAGISFMKEVKANEIVEVGGVGLTGDHRVYVGETETRRADALLGIAQAPAVAWGASNNPLRGWTHVWVLAAALARACAHAAALLAREAVRGLVHPVRLHGMWNRNDARMGQCPSRKDDAVCEVCTSCGSEALCHETVGEDAR